MKKTTKIGVVLTLVTMLYSCSTYRFREKSSDYLAIDKGTIQQVSKTADYEVMLTKTKGKYEGLYSRFGNKEGVSIESAKNFAIANAISNAKCDFLVNPLYDIKIEGTSITVSVEGLPAHYTSFKTTEGSPKSSSETEKNKSKTKYRDLFIKQK